MKIQDVLLMQNRFIDTFTKSDQLEALKKFNKELIEECDFNDKYFILFSIRATKLLVKNGYRHRGYSMGKNYNSYENSDCSIKFSYFNGTDTINVWGKNFNMFISESDINDELFLTLAKF